MKRWRATVATWAAAGFDRYPMFKSAGSALSRFTYCSPAFVSHTGERRYCMRAWLCPWCYARSVKDVWEAIDLAVFPPASSRPRIHSAFDPLARHFDVPDLPVVPIVTAAVDLVIRQTSQRFARTVVSDGNEVDMLRACLKRRCVATATGLTVRIAEWRKLQHLGVSGGIEIVTAFPDYKPNATKASGWVVVITQLMLVPKSQGESLVAKFVPDKDTTITCPLLSNRMDLVDAVASALRYPLALIVAPPAIVHEIAKARSDLRLTARFGTLRNRAES